MTIDEAIQILGLYDLGNVFLDIDGNPISHEKMSSACDMAVEALRKQVACDCVSRQAVLDTIGNVPDHDDGMVFEALSHAQRDVALLPPVTPQPKIGRWIESNGYDDRDRFYTCSECGRSINLICGAKLIDYPYCHCGAKMEVENERT